MCWLFTGQMFDTHLFFFFVWFVTFIVNATLRLTTFALSALVARLNRLYVQVFVG